MKQVIMIEPKDIKKILAEKFNVPEKNITKSQYSYYVEKENEENEQ